MTRSWGRSALARLLIAVAALSAATALALPRTVGAAPPPHSRPDCGVHRAVAVDDEVACTHGGDPAPGSPLLARDATPAAVPPAPCPGDGVSGRRIVVAYGYPADTSPRAKTLRPVIREALGLADANLDAASHGFGGQHYRLFCQRDVQVTLRAWKLVPIGSDDTFTFSDLITSLADRVANGLGDEDLDDPDTIYSVFVDHIGCCYGPAGQATYSHDDRPDPAVNRNNQPLSPRYSLVRLGYSTIALAGIWQHEIGHNLGAVQDSAPHTSGNGHCYESFDVMCYNDGGPWFQGGGGMVANCVAGMPDGQEIFDCNGDDYYAVAPVDGSYLTDHWNLADNRWLTRPT